MGYLRETCNSQNTNPISKTLKLTLAIIKILTKACVNYVLCQHTYVFDIILSSIKIFLSAQKQCLNIRSNPRGQGV